MQELVIKVPAPFSGIADLGFSARYPEQGLNEKLRDVPFIIEGPAVPMQRLIERLTLFADKEVIVKDGEEEAYVWTPPVQLSDEVCILAFRDRSLNMLPSLEDSVASRGYVWNLVRPLAFTFLRDCVRIGQLRLAERIDVLLDPGHPPAVELELERTAITPENGSFLLHGI